MKTKTEHTHYTHFSWVLGLFLTITTLPGFAQEVTLWNQAATPVVTAEADANPVEVGVKVRVTAPGHIIGLWFYKGLGNDGLHTGNLWMGDGTLLATTDFIGETPEGWQRADFPAPVAVIAGQTYVLSYFAPQGNYAVDQSFFATAGVVSGSLVLLQNGIDGDNGVYDYNASSIFPGSSYEASNYWVDPIYISADTDADGDGILNANDNCPVDFNPGQEDEDVDGIGNVCDTVVGADSDNDGIADGADNCPITPNTNQDDADNDGIGDVCEPDTDGDGVIDDDDNCPANANPGQEDSDSNGIGDACDFSTDPDKDTLGNLNCSIQQIAKFNGSQWVCADEAQGPAGPQGATGAAGTTGAVGTQGLAGADSTVVGPTGPAGPPGAAADPAQIDALQVQIDALQVLIDTFHPTYSIGDTGPGGGIVFHTTNSGLNGLEAAPVDQTSNAQWCPLGLIDIANVDNLPSAATPDSNSGADNTPLIMVQCGSNSAAGVAANYVWPNGQTDGFLPNKEELNLLFNQRNVVGGFAQFLYWSSSELGSGFGWLQNFPHGFQSNVNKTNPYRVRTVRAF